MAAPSVATHYKDIVHNLGYKPIVRVFVYLSEYGMVGWRQLPLLYWAALGYGMYEQRNLYYEHIDINTLRIYGLEGQEILVQLFLEPREDAWHG